MRNATVFLALQRVPCEDKINLLVNETTITPDGRLKDEAKKRADIEKKRADLESRVTSFAGMTDIKSGHIQIFVTGGEEVHLGLEPDDAEGFKQSMEIIADCLNQEDIGYISVVGVDCRNTTKCLALEAAKQGYPITSKFWYGTHDRFELLDLLPVSDPTTVPFILQTFGIESSDLQVTTPSDEVALAVRLAKMSGVLV